MDLEHPAITQTLRTGYPPSAFEQEGGLHMEEVLEGLVCEHCGEFLDGEAPGHPRPCEECA